jgi:hypothetical protein
MFYNCQSSFSSLNMWSLTRRLSNYMGSYQVTQTGTQIPFPIHSMMTPMSPLYCVNRPPGSRYPSPSHKGSFPKCSIIRRLRKRMRIGRR